MSNDGSVAGEKEAKVTPDRLEVGKIPENVSTSGSDSLNDRGLFFCFYEATEDRSIYRPELLINSGTI